LGQRHLVQYVANIGTGAYGFKFRDSGFGFRISGFGFLGCGFQISNFELQGPDFGFWVWGLGPMI